MKIVTIHNQYQFRGGEDAVFSSERDLLRSKGHDVIEYLRDNHEIERYGAWDNAALGFRTIWAQKSMRDLREILRREKPDVAHFHNTFPLVSPGAYFVCAEEDVPVVQTVQNYRLICPAATCFRANQICEKCLGHTVPWPGIVHRCYRKSTLATGTVAAMLAAHRVLGSWRSRVDSYIAPSQFVREKLIQGGLPGDRIRVKPNFVRPDPGLKNVTGDYALFIGRLCEEKGVRVLLAAWQLLESPPPLIIAGTGKLHAEIAQMAAHVRQTPLKLVGQVDHDEIIGLMHKARFLIFPSIWYEGFPVSIVEAFACGLPVVASRLGAMEEAVADHHTGLHFSPGNSDELAAQCLWAWNHPGEMQQMGLAARAEYEAKYTAEKNYKMLTNIYDSVRDKIALRGERDFLRSNSPHAQGAR